MPLQNLALILGGAASGKSAFAEGLVTGLGQPRAYLATAQAWDEEMQARIARHREARGPAPSRTESAADTTLSSGMA